MGLEQIWDGEKFEIVRSSSFEELEDCRGRILHSDELTTALREESKLIDRITYLTVYVADGVVFETFLEPDKGLNTGGNLRLHIVRDFLNTQGIRNYKGKLSVCTQEMRDIRALPSTLVQEIGKEYFSCEFNGGQLIINPKNFDQPNPYRYNYSIDISFAQRLFGTDGDINPNWEFLRRRVTRLPLCVASGTYGFQVSLPSEGLYWHTERAGGRITSFATYHFGIIVDKWNRQVGAGPVVSLGRSLSNPFYVACRKIESTTPI